MIYADNYYSYLVDSSIFNAKEMISWGNEAITDLFFTKAPPAMSLPDCLERVRLNTNVQSLKLDWQVLAPEAERKKELWDIYTDYQDLMRNHGRLVDIKHPQLFGDLGLFSGVPGLWMPGIAMIATHLKEKKGLEGLFVCADRKALCSKIEEIIINPKDQRCALVVGASSGGDKDFPLHKMAICVEKQEGRLQIAVLDSFGGYSYNEGVVCELLETCKKNGSIPEFLLSVEKRESAGYGCGVFALQDAVSFLQDEQFFQYIDFDYIKMFVGLEVKIISALPPGFMIGTQAMSGVLGYKKNEGQEVFDQAIKGRKKTLDEYLQRNVLVVNGKSQNHYITKKTLQYQRFIVSALKELNSKEVKSLINATLIT